MKLHPSFTMFASITRSVRLAASLVVVAWALLFPLADIAHAEGVHIRVRGTAKLSAHASRDQGELVMTGTLADDAGQPLPNETVTIHVTRESDPKDPTVIQGLRAARSCDRGTDRPPTAFAVRAVPVGDSADVLVVTDEAGRFCFRARLVPDRHLAHLTWKGSALVDATDADLGFDLSRQALLLRFDPTPRIIALDNPKIDLEAAALVEDDGATVAKQGLGLVLANEKGEELGRAVTDSSGRARFGVAVAKLGPPGRGSLKVSFAGDGQTGFAVHVAEIERRVKVIVHSAAAERGELKPQIPEEGIPLDVEVTSAVGPVSEGAIEASVGDTVVGAAPVERGLARLTLTFAAQGSDVGVRLRYVPTSPWYEPLGDLTVRVPIRGPSLTSKLPILLAGLAVLAFFLVGRVASKGNKPEPAPAKVEPATNVGKPRLEVVRPAARGELGWRGRIVDAHEGSPVRNARVWIERGTFDGRVVLASMQTDSHGGFQFAHLPGLVGDEQMAAEAPLHARLAQPLPPAGEISIALVLRRRQLLARLVKWARGRGRPFDVKPEPTPGHVRRAAADDLQTARWADAIEKAVFGGGEVDARLEGEIERMAPPDPVAQRPAKQAPGAPGPGESEEQDERR